MGQPTTGNAVVSIPQEIKVWRGTKGTETSKYLEEKKSTEIP